MNNKVFKVAGIATDKKGNTKVRYANNLVDRIKILSRDNFTNINLVELDNQYDKFEICQILLKMSNFDEYKDIITQELEKIKQNDEKYSFKLQKSQYKLALANKTSEKVI